MSKNRPPYCSKSSRLVFFFKNKQTNEQKAPADEMERASRNPNILQQTNGFLLQS